MQYNLMFILLLIIPTARGYWISERFERALTQRDLAAQALVSQIEKKNISVSFYSRDWGSFISSTWRYRGTPEAFKALSDYTKAAYEHDNLTIVTTVGDGFLLGVILACAGRLMKVRLTKKKIMATLLTTFLLAFQQSNSIGTVSTIDRNLIIGTENFYMRLIGRWIGISIGTCLGAVGTDYIIKRCTQSTQESYGKQLRNLLEQLCSTPL